MNFHRSDDRRGRLAQTMILVLALLSVTAACAPGEETGSDGAEAASPAGPSAAANFRNTDPQVQYVGAENCRDCHQALYASHTQTGMGRAFYPMSPDVVVEDFTVNNEVYVENTGIRYRMFERDGTYWQRQYVLDSLGNELVGTEREMVWVVGSNNHSRSYLTVIEGKTFQAPICWYPQTEHWDLCPGFEFKNEHFGREVAPDCLFCHNGKMELEAGTRNKFKTPFPHGIGCERCHGPGELHVDHWQTGAQPTGEVDDTIVNPRRLPKKERIEVCFQCHLGDARATARVGIFGRDIDEFRPGMQLNEVALAFTYEQPTQVDFGLSSQADRLLLSKCYTESDGAIECLTCHDPHLTVYHEDRPQNHFRNKCLGCHDVSACPAPDDRRAATKPLADDCLQCHMRKAEPDDQRFTEFTDHWIRRNIDFEEQDHRTNYKIRGMVAGDLERFSKGEQLYYRGRAAFLLAQDAPRSRHAELWDDAEEQFRKAIDIGYEHQDVWFFLGKTLTFQGRSSDAISCYEKALEFDADHHDALFALAGEQLKLGDPVKALAPLDHILANDSDDVMSLAEYGRALTAIGRKPEAVALLQRAVELEPWDPTLQLNLGMSLAMVGRFDEAAQAGRRAVELDPERLQSWSLFYNAMREAGNLEESREGQWFSDRLTRLKAEHSSDGTASSM